MSAPWTNKELYQFLLKESTCSLCKADCEKSCRDCKCYTEKQKAHSMYDQLIKIIKSRSPELYFVDDLTELENLIAPLEDKSK